MSEIIIILAGFVSGASLIGCLVLGYLWWNSQRSPRPAAKPPPSPQVPPQPDAFATIPPGPDRAGPLTDNHLIPQGNHPWLDGVGGMVSGQRMLIERPEVMLGRSRVCDIQLHDPKVSRQHATLRLYQGNYFIQDMQSSRGTMVNDRVVDSQVLNDGDKIRMGDSVVIFRLPEGT